MPPIFVSRLIPLCFHRKTSNLSPGDFLLLQRIGLVSPGTGRFWRRRRSSLSLRSVDRWRHASHITLLGGRGVLQTRDSRRRQIRSLEGSLFLATLLPWSGFRFKA
jgi:hypothetical protein